MKKTYQNPKMEIVTLNTHALLAGSDPKLGGTYQTGGAVLGRESEDFDDEE